MFPIFMWVKEYKGLKDFEITFDNDYLINIKDGFLSLEKKLDTMYIPNFYSNNIESINLLIGKNGVGKTSILNLLTLFNHKKHILYESIYSEEVKDHYIIDFYELDHLIIYKNYSKEFEGKFIIEKYSKKNVDTLDNSRVKNLKEVIDVNIDFDKIYNNLEEIEKFKKIGMIKFNLFNSKHDNILELLDDNEKKIKKIYFNMEFQSKEKVYTYINVQNKVNKENFENAKMIISINKDIYSDSEYFNEIINILDYDRNISSVLYDELILYEINEEDSTNDIILKNYCNKLFLREIYYSIEYDKNEKIKESPINTIKIIKEEIKNKYSNSPKKFLEYFIKNSRKSFLHDFYKKIIDISKNMEELIKNKNIIILTENKEEKLSKFSFNINKYDKEIVNFLRFYDSFKILNNKVYKRLKESSGEYIEEIISIYEEGLSDGEKIKLEYFSTLYGVLEGEFKDKKYITLLFDEVEAFLHPEWSRIFLYELIKELEEKYPEKKFKLIFATHSPFLIADVLAKDCIYLKKENGKIEAKIDNNKKTFGANIIDLFKNTMFLKSTFGEFATKKIKWVVKKIDEIESYFEIKNNPEINYIIEEIGEKLISNKLKSMIEAKFENNDKEYYKNKIKEYEARIKEIEKAENNKRKND
ncbi:AAA family ATPase [Fusobacterium hwasookii]|uniref:AAA family ATPase n=1 Tax=Fusobacterium hwasookii TaxID=1583098 RepID=UPI00162408EA|nr:AAA family ATPase [Fusobacterium hwasookii]QNE67232.1 AAA family ATPase [Fusobacterium hwasookii]